MKIKFPNFPLGLRQSTPRRFRHLRGGVLVPEQGLGRREWVLSRSIVHFARFELRSVPKAHRAQALQMQIRQWSPYARSGRYLLWDKDCAMVWAWDVDAVEAAMAANGLHPRGIAVVPETLLKPRHPGGAILAACLEGCEGQLWREGNLAASRWWPAAPSEGAWVNFQRDAGALPDEIALAVPTPAPLALAERPWGKPEELDRSAAISASGERWVLPAAALGLMVATLWYGAQIVKLRMEIGAREEQFQALTQRAEPVMAARIQAMEALERIRALQGALDRYPDQASLMVKVAEILPADGTHLAEWEFQNGRLKLQIAPGSKLSSSDFVKRFEASGHFENVQATVAGGATGLVMTMDVLPKSMLRVASVPSGRPR